MAKRKPTKKVKPPDRKTLNQAILWAALRAIASKQLEKIRGVLESGKLYPFSLGVEGQVGKPSRPVSLSIAGQTHRGHDSQQDRSPPGIDLLCAIREILTPTEWRRVTRRLPVVLRDADLEPHKEGVAKLLKPLKTATPKAGEVKAVYTITAARKP